MQFNKKWRPHTIHFKDYEYLAMAQFDPLYNYLVLCDYF